MCFLAAAAAQHNGADDQEESQEERNDVADTREQGRRVGGGRKHGVDDPRLAPGKLLYDIAPPVDHCADSRRRRSKHGQAFLGRAQPRLGEMLRGPPSSEPGIV